MPAPFSLGLIHMKNLERDYWRQQWALALAGTPGQHPKLQLMKALGYRTHAPSGLCHAATDYYAAWSRGVKPRNPATARLLQLVARG